MKSFKIYFYVISFVFCLNSFSEKLKNGCEKVFKVDKSIFKTNEKFQDKKYSLDYLKALDKSKSLLKVVSDYDPLTKEEQLQLFKIYQDTKDERSRYILYFSNLRIAYKMTLKGNIRDDKFDDYFQENLVVLLSSLDSYTPSKGSFYNYAKRQMEFNFVNYKARRDMIFKQTGDYKLLSLLKKEQEADPYNFGTSSWIRKFREKHKQYDDLKIDYGIMSLPSSEPIQEQRLVTRLSSSEGGEKRFSSEKDILEHLPNKQDNLEKKVTDQVYIMQIYDWVLKQIRKEEKRHLWEDIAKEHIFTTDFFAIRPRKTLSEISKKHGVSKRQSEYILAQIRKMIKLKFNN